MSGAQNPIITKFVFFHKICDAKRTQRDHTFFGPRANMFQKTIFFRAPSKHVLKVKIKNTVSLEGNTFPLKEIRFPLKETRLPLKEIRFPLKETRFPLKETRFPLKEIRFPLKETCFCQANVDLLCSDSGWLRFGDIRNFDMNRFLMHSM